MLDSALEKVLESRDKIPRESRQYGEQRENEGPRLGYGDDETRSGAAPGRGINYRACSARCLKHWKERAMNSGFSPCSTRTSSGNR